MQLGLGLGLVQMHYNMKSNFLAIKVSDPLLLFISLIFSSNSPLSEHIVIII